MMKKSKFESFLIASYIVFAALAYGHSYTNNPYRMYRKMATFTNVQAGFAAVVAPAYWLSVLGVWIFEAEEKKDSA